MQERIINGVLVYIAAGFVACQIALFTSCRPFSGYWAVPAPDGECCIFVSLDNELIKASAPGQCWSYFNFEVVEGTLNVSADVVVLVIALPLLVKLSMPIQQKMILMGVFGMGVFVIIAALLTKVYSLDPSLTSYSYLNWYFREASVSLYVTNLPALWALARECCPALKNLGYSSQSWTDAPRDITAWPSHYGAKHNNNTADDLEMLEVERDNKFWKEMPCAQSQEPINRSAASEFAIKSNG
jgi:hypothetical protein